MFNIAPTELLLVGIIALLVIGPERLPSTIKTVSLWVGRFRRSFYKVKNEIERELNADEIRRQLHNEAVMDDLESAKSQMSKLAKETEKSISNIVSSDELDPGAAKPKPSDETDSVEEKPALSDAQDSNRKIEEKATESKQQLYGSGKNPKLGSPSEKAESE
jgi:sec-independent protein translocase protein TatB